LLTELVEVILIASVAVTFLSMWANVLYRKHEIGILKSLGGSRAFVIGIVSTDAALIGLGRAILAVLFSQSILVWPELPECPNGQNPRTPENENLR
jgi:putative ABC transport system permease protein